jgi:phage antirepressor YoqD-like protein
MTVGDLANEYGIPKHTACLIAREAIHAFSRVHKGEAYSLTKTQIATLRPLFLAARPAPRPCSMPLFLIVEDKPMMTVKEVAEALGVHIDTVNSWVKKLYPDLPRNGVPTMLDEAQATEIKQGIERSGRSDLRNIPQLQNVQTELEIAAMTAKVLGYWKDRAESLAVEVAGKTEALALAAPKVEAFDRFIGASGSLCIMDAAQTLGQAPLKFFDKLEAAGMIFRRGNDWLPTQYYIEKAYFEVKTRTFGEGEQARITKQTRVTPKGLDGLAKLFSAQVPV